MKRFLIPAFLAVLVAFGATHAADIPWPSEYIHITNSATAQGVDDVPPSAYAHITNWASALTGFMTTDGSNAESLALQNISHNSNTGLQFGIPGAAHDGTTDDTVAINAALSACATAGGGVVQMGPFPYLSTSASIVVPPKCWLKGTWPGGSINPVTSWIGNTMPKLIISSTFPITVGGGVSNLFIMRQGLTNPSSLQNTVTNVAAFAGTAITTITGAANDDFRLHTLAIVGFDQCVNVQNRQRPVIWDIDADCNKGLRFDNVHDVGHIWSIHGWPFYPGNSGFASTTQSVSAVADNGSGLIRLTIADATGLATGNTVYNSAIGGFTGANGTWVITVVDGTHIDLQGSSFASFTTTGTWVSGETFVTLASLVGVVAGENVSGTNIASSTTVRAVDYSNSGIWLSKVTTGVGSGTTLTFSSNSYTSGGSVMLDTGVRPGPFISTTNGEEIQFSGIFAYDYKVGYYAGVSSIWAEYTTASCDSSSHPDFVCMEWDSSARLTQWNGGEGGGNMMALVDKTTGGVGNAVNGVQMRTGGFGGNGAVQISIHSGSTSNRVLSALFNDGGTSPPQANTIAIYNASGTTKIDGQLTAYDLYPQNSPTMDAVLIGKGTQFFAGSPYRYEPKLSWTPVFLVGGGGSPVYVAQNGRAEINWPYMTANYQIALSSIGGTGTIQFNGLPFSCTTALENGLASIHPIYVSAAAATTVGGVFGWVPDAAENVIIPGKPAAGGYTQLSNTDLTANVVFAGQLRCRMAFVQR